MKNSWLIILALSCVWLMQAPEAWAQESAAVEHLAKLRANPLSGLRTVTLQEQANLNFPANGESQHVLTLQAIWPFSLGQNWSLITYPTLSAISQPGLSPGESRVSGLGNTVLTTVVTPNETGTLIWGIGPVLEIPTATNHDLGSPQWAAGPALGLFVQPDPWTAGVLLQNAWSFAGSPSGRINAFEGQYFLAYNLPKGWFLQSNGTVTADWEADEADRWTVPAGGGFGKVFTLGTWSMSASSQAFYNAIRPTSGPDWSLSLALQVLFPG